MCRPTQPERWRFLAVSRAMRICLIYDCLFPYTVGGAERWYRNLAERLVAEGHEVTYLTLRQWARGERLELDPRIRVVCAGPRMPLYTGPRRRVLPPLVFGAGVLWHLLRHGRRYDVVHTASFPYFSLLAAGLARRFGRFALVVDWHEVWSRDYWREYLGRVGGAMGYAVQLLCARLPQRAFCFSRLHAGRLREEGLRGEVTVLEGEYAGPLDAPTAVPAEQLVVFAGRMIPEKRAPVGVAGVVAAAPRIPGLRGVFFGDGPEREAVLDAIARLDAGTTITAPGFVDAEQLEEALASALCMLLPSSREGYGMVVVEASAKAVPSVVVAAPDNAAVELVAEGVNGTIAADADPETIAAAIVRVHEAGMAMRESTARWFAENTERLSLEGSLRVVQESYASSVSGPSAHR
ncbi:MAG TPA: glycosyltransferase [Solirubrobacteraceae bacterium]|nr:glycosyltransferase [Solirubrobacteraceae bacterium]